MKRLTRSLLTIVILIALATPMISSADQAPPRLDTLHQANILSGRTAVAQVMGNALYLPLVINSAPMVTQPAMPYIGTWEYTSTFLGNSMVEVFAFKPNGSFEYRLLVILADKCDQLVVIGQYRADAQTIMMNGQSAREAKCDGKWSPTSPLDFERSWRVTSDPDVLHLGSYTLTRVKE